MDFYAFELILFLLVYLSSTSLEVSNEDPKQTSSDELSGHMQPLGSHMLPEYVKRLSDFVTPSDFVEQYVRPKQPVVFEGLLKNLEVREKWADDNYLRCLSISE